MCRHVTTSTLSNSSHNHGWLNISGGKSEPGNPLQPSSLTNNKTLRLSTSLEVGRRFGSKLELRRLNIGKLTSTTTSSSSWLRLEADWSVVGCGHWRDRGADQSHHTLAVLLIVSKHLSHSLNLEKESYTTYLEPQAQARMPRQQRVSIKAPFVILLSIK